MQYSPHIFRLSEAIQALNQVPEETAILITFLDTPPPYVPLVEESLLSLHLASFQPSHNESFGQSREIDWSSPRQIRSQDEQRDCPTISDTNFSTPWQSCYDEDGLRTVDYRGAIDKSLEHIDLLWDNHDNGSMLEVATIAVKRTLDKENAVLVELQLAKAQLANSGYCELGLELVREMGPVYGKVERLEVELVRLEEWARRIRQEEDVQLA